MPNENRLSVRNGVIVLVIVAVMGMMLFLVNDPYGLKVLLLLACVLWAKPFVFLSKSAIDKAILLLWVYDMILCFTSINAFVSVRASRNSTILFFAYLLLRQVVEYPKSARLLKQGICVIMGMALLLSLFSFFIFRHLVNEKRHEKTIQTVPYLINEGILCMNRFKNTSKEEYLQQAEMLLSEAQKKQPEDVSIDYLLAELDLLKGEEERAQVTLEELTKCYPQNTLYQYKLYRLLYDKGRKAEAAEHLEAAILLSPRVLGMEDIRMLEKADSCFYHHLLDNLLSRHPVNTDRPSDFARYGFIAFFCGRMNEAERFLSQAVTEMPNLSTPWRLLGEVKQKKGENEVAEVCLRKYKLLTFGAFTNSKELARKDLKLTFLQEKDLFQSYSMKFREWYGCKLIIPQ